MTTTATKLADIDPTQLGASVTALVLEHMVKQALRVGITGPLPKPSIPELALAVEELTRYAQAGPPHCDDGGPAEYIQTVVEALHTSAHPDAYTHAPTAFSWLNSDPEHDIDRVLLAAQARAMVSSGDLIPLAWLAALGGASVSFVRKQLSQGALDGSRDSNKRSCVMPGSAETWLSARGVPGFGPR